MMLFLLFLSKDMISKIKYNITEVVLHKIVLYICILIGYRVKITEYFTDLINNYDPGYWNLKVISIISFLIASTICNYWTLFVTSTLKKSKYFCWGWLTFFYNVKLKCAFFFYQKVKMCMEQNLYKIWSLQVRIWVKLQYC